MYKRQGRRVTGQGKDQTENDERRPDEHRNHLEDASDDVSGHGVPHDTVGPSKLIRRTDGCVITDESLHADRLEINRAEWSELDIGDLV